MSDSPLVSVVVPLYNQKRYLLPCISSIIKQTYRNLEIIIVNDGSTDDSLNRAKAIAKTDDRIFVYDKQNEGTSYARRDGYLRSNGKYIMFVDDDDLLPSSAVQTMVEQMEGKNLDMIIGRVARKLGPLVKSNAPGSFPVDEVVTNPELFNNYYIGFFQNTVFPINIWGRIYRKSIVDHAYKETELFSSQMPCMAGDEYFNLKLFPYLKSMYQTSELVYIYRLGGAVDHYNRFFPETFVLTDIRLALLDDYGYQKGYRPLYIEYINMVYYHAMQILQYKQGDKDDVISFYKKELSTRNVVPRLIDHFANNPTLDDGTRLLVERNYEGMFDYAKMLLRNRKSSIKYKFRTCILKIIEKYF